MAADPHPQPLDQLFPRCRLRSSPPVDTAVLIDLSDDNHLIPNIQAAANSRMATISATKQDSDSDASPLRRPPSLALQQQRRFAPPLKSSELRRSSGNKMRRAKTLMDGATWTGLFDAYGTGGYEPSSDSEENDSDCSPSMNKSTASFNKRITSGSITGVRSSASESHIVGQQQWSKKTGELSSPASALVTARSRTVKEIYDLTPTRLDLSEGSGAAEGGLRDGGGGEQPATRLEIAGGREVVSVSRTRNCRAASQRKRHSAAVVHNNNNNNHHNSSASASSSITRYSGEVYYEESVGRYGFHVGGGNTLWGSQGLEPTFSIPSCLNEKLPGTISHSSSSGSHASSHQGTKRPLSWAGDDGPELTLSQEPNNGESIRTEEKAKIEIEEPTELEARDSNNSTTEFRGYLVDFYPEMVTAASEEHQVNCQTNHIEEPSTLNLDNYLSEQLNQFAQQSTNRKEPEESVQPTAQQLTVATVIGGLTIAQYEGSPRRYGVRPHLPSQNQDGQDEINNKSPSSSSSSLTPAVNGSVSRPVIVPGFPRRIAPNPAQQLGTLPTFSPSTTRQTLVDLVLSPIDHNHVAQSNVLQQQQHNNLPWHLEPEENTDTVTLGNNNCMPTLDPADDETDLGETEVGLEVGGRSRNFTLSPETTDYDDSELDIHDPSHLPEASNNSLCMSAAVMSGSDNSCSEPGGSGKRRRGSNTQNGTGSSASVKGQFNSMPVLEDGLSSGQSSIGSDGSNSERDSGGSSVSETEEEEEDARAIHDRVPLMTGTASKTRNIVQHNGAPSSGSQRLPANHNGKQQLWVKKLAIHSECLSDGTSLRKSG